MCDKVVGDKVVVCEGDVCEKVVCERVVCDKVACDKVACERSRDICERLRVTMLCVTKSYFREMDSLAAWMSPSAMPATQTAAATTAPNGNQAGHQTQSSAIQ